MSGQAQSWVDSNAAYRDGSHSLLQHDFDGAFRALDECIRLSDGEYKGYVERYYETRAEVYEAQSCFNYALRDVQKIIELAHTPWQWPRYHHSARLLASQGKQVAALKMCTMALGNLSSMVQGMDDTYRRQLHKVTQELTELRQRLESTPPPCLISSLPGKLLVTIFTFSNNPAVIAHVCHEWRAVAHSHPALWRNLVLTTTEWYHSHRRPYREPRAGDGALRKIDEWHRRSSGWIAELYIRESLGKALFPSGVGQAPDPSGMYDDIIAALRRLDLTKLKECHLQNMDLVLFLCALGGDDVGLNNLESLSSGSEIGSAYSDPVQVTRASRTLSWQSLRRLSLAGVQCNWGELSKSMCCLTSLEYKIKDAGDYHSYFRQFLLANASTLEKLVVEIAKGEVPKMAVKPNTPHFGDPPPTPPTPPTPPEPLALVHLRHLELEGIIPFDISYGNITLPSLRILRIPSAGHATLVLPKLLEDEGASIAELVEFVASGFRVEPQILSAVLLGAPKLEILRCINFEAVAVAESLSKPCTTLLRDPSTQLLVPVPLPALCPALRVLDLSHSDKLKADPVVRIIKERFALVASEDDGRYQLPGVDGDQWVSRIQTLTLDYCPQIEDDKLPWFRENVPEFSCHRSRT